MRIAEWGDKVNTLRERLLNGAPFSMGLRGKAIRDENGIITDFELDSVSVITVQEQEQEHAGSSDREEA